MAAQTQRTIVVTGADGRVADLLRRSWQSSLPGLPVLWSSRGPGRDLQWDILSGPAPALPQGAVILHLAGVLRGPAKALEANHRMIPPLMAAAQAARASAVLLASTAAVYAAGPQDCTEDSAPDPRSDYGWAKLAAEGAALALVGGRPVTALRIGNVLGADALFAPRPGPILLDPVPGRPGGPVRSWIGPQTLALALARLVPLACSGALPPVLNLAQSPPLPMEALLCAARRPWAYGPPNPGVVPRHALDTRRLGALLPLPRATPCALTAELAGLQEVSA
ncbi:NAD-dependent epimerase/dehydratase family protein [Rhodobacter sp. Har01]|uniref:NAD-dependent epimerase/dehydratase family protein n=1 Tax=Rhodobacter sp. Har01 TaxID=2883999 RepID=UPI001D0875A8|nr:NAD-dependent epimerase/dehydratase family protein [Rhodobacter sp. Har01]MCB6178032.1 NAD-dependent epimerase/dehydratase family protein [Rhodobacter sp. Har01]